MSYKFLKENGYPVDLILSSEKIEATDNNSWNDVKITVKANNEVIEVIYCKKENYSDVIRSYQKGFFAGIKFAGVAQ